MNFQRAKPGGWALFEILTSAQMNLIDTQVEFALDGGAGGIYSPTGSLRWRNKWIVDTSPGGFPAGAAFEVITDPGRTAIIATGGADGGQGGLFSGGLRTRAIRARGGSSDTLVPAAEGILGQGGNNVAGGTGGGGVIGEGGEGDTLGGFGGSFVGGAAQLPGGTGGAGVSVAGGAGHTNGPGGAGGGFLGGAAPGAGLGGRGVFGTGGTSVSGLGGNGVVGTGGIGPGGGGHGVVGAGAGSTYTPLFPRAGGAFKAGTVAGSVGAVVEAVAGSNAALVVFGHATGGPALVSVGLGNNDAIRGDTLNGDGYAVWARAKIAAPVRSPLHLDPQDALPSVAQAGDVQFGTNAHASGGRMLVYQTAPFGVGTWQSVSTNLTRESVKAFASVTLNAGVITVHKAYNLTFSIVGAGAASRLRCTFAIPFASAFDYQPQSTPISVAAQDRYPVIAQVDVGFFDIALYDISANAYQQLDGGGGANFTFRISVTGGYD